MPPKKDDKKSDFRMFWSHTTFTNEPVWYRLAVIIVMVAGVVLTVYLLKQWVVVGFVGKLKSVIMLWMKG